ncbi:hypothetical protein ABN763_06730 [Spongiivirga sp. MCCC 1A20706]|uniref:hypothetical protein n=1 Tax=Spongiivirga sp. MCCC 1A20706 TaxID=3160963 RepID=UPI0039778AF5
MSEQGLLNTIIKASTIEHLGDYHDYEKLTKKALGRAFYCTPIGLNMTGNLFGLSLCSTNRKTIGRLAALCPNPVYGQKWRKWQKCIA